MAESLLFDAGASDGLFLVRDSSSHQGAFVLSLVEHGDVVHHLVEPEDGRYGLFQWTFRNLDDMVDYLRLPHPEHSWATPLKFHVPFNGVTYTAATAQRSGSFHSSLSLERGRTRIAIEPGMIQHTTAAAYAELPRGAVEPVFMP